MATPRIAAKDAVNRQNAASNRTVFLEREHRVFGTGGRVSAAGRKMGRKNKLITTDQSDQDETRNSNDGL